jgi:glycosyltransferase involved in cell wall biosynthesis
VATVALWADNVLADVKSGMAYYQSELLKALDASARPDEYTVFYTPRRRRERYPLNFRHLALRALPGTRHLYYPLWHSIKAPKVERFLGDVRLIHLLHASVTVPSRRPSIVWVVDLASARLSDAFPNRRRLFKHTALRRAAANPSVTFTANAEFVKDELCELYDVAPDRVDVVYLGVDTDRFQPVADGEIERVRARYGLREPFFLFVGLVSPRKNVDVLIEGFSRFRGETDSEYELVLAGGPGWDYETVSNLADNTAGVRRLGFVPDDDLPALYSVAEALVLPSSYEGFGLPLLEAMACGTAVIASNVTALPEVVGDAGLLLDELSAEAIAASFERIATDSDFRQELVDRGTRRARQFTWSRAAEQCRELHRQRLEALEA